MSSIEKKEQNLNQLIDKLNSLSLSYSQPNYEIEKIKLYFLSFNFNPGFFIQKTIFSINTIDFNCFITVPKI